MFSTCAIRLVCARSTAAGQAECSSRWSQDVVDGKASRRSRGVRRFRARRARNTH
ncbi:MAG: hypothetical protein WBM69_19390 [Desulfobacterales bacterium]